MKAKKITVQQGQLLMQMGGGSEDQRTWITFDFMRDADYSATTGNKESGFRPMWVVPRERKTR